MPKRIAIIGAGVAGIISAKCCLEQGLEVVVFDKTDYIGGLWRYQEHLDVNGIASVMKSTVINTSKEVSSFSDYPPPKEAPNYMHNSLNIAYYEAYAARINFTQYVRFRHEIVATQPAADYEETGRWKVHYRALDSKSPDTIHEEIFDGVMICVGHHNVRNEPKFKGQEKFRGRILHTHSLKHAKGFEDKTVVVVGIGNSATDAAVELATVTRQVYLSTRRGSWIFHRVGHNGVPFDLNMQTRLSWWLMSILPFWFVCTVLEWYLNGYLDHAKYQLKPKHRALSAHITMNDALPNRIMCGTVKIKADIDHFTEDGVVFKGETEVTKCDAVVLGTGYKVDIPFLPESILQVNRNRVRLFKHMFVPHLKHPQTLAVIGLFQSVGAGIPAAELQARWYASLNAGKGMKLPNREVMERDVEKKTKEIKEKYYESDRHTFQVDWIPYMDELAVEIGCKPPLWKYLATDLKLFLALVFGPALPYQYRLVGPNKWSGAREAILTVRERIEAPLKTNAVRLAAEKQKQKKAINDLTYADLFLWFLIGGMAISSACTWAVVSLL